MKNAIFINIILQKCFKSFIYLNEHVIVMKSEDHMSVA